MRAIFNIRFHGAKRTRLPVRGFLQQPQPHTARTRIETRRSLVRQVEGNDIHITSSREVIQASRTWPTHYPQRSLQGFPWCLSGVFHPINWGGDEDSLALTHQPWPPKQSQGCRKGGSEEPVRTRASEPGRYGSESGHVPEWPSCQKQEYKK